MENNSDVMGLALFIHNRLLWNPDIAAEYRHPTVPHLYRDGNYYFQNQVIISTYFLTCQLMGSIFLGHEEALSKFTLKKLLLLVCFLDRAKRCRIIDHDPCLFCKDAEFKVRGL